MLEVRGNDAVVAVGVDEAHGAAARRSAHDASAERRRRCADIGDAPEVHVQTEIDLRGMRPDEAETAVLQALDAPCAPTCKSLRIIHGKGTGALRERVDEMLRKDTRVESSASARGTRAAPA